MIAIIDYDAGNLTSVERAVRYLGQDCTVTRDLKAISQAERIIFPGVGAAGSAMESLKKYGLDKALWDAMDSGKPILGICLGTQIITSFSQENRGVQCLGLVEGEVLCFPDDMHSPEGDKLKVPHMGWNNVQVVKEHPVLADVRPEHQFYFVHSYYPMAKDPDQVLAQTQYGLTFSSVMGRDNLIATQFHPEKSGKPGLALLKNFIAWKP
ncbi:MAG: imidazole glycerol phosphate synthase subunit HisH [Desulfatibacillum sp.]|nr:imidazole glycerol phosphate synthase subunit HisH [Desulfatibacillum sp.]